MSITPLKPSSATNSTTEQPGNTYLVGLFDCGEFSDDSSSREAQFHRSRKGS